MLTTGNNVTNIQKTANDNGFAAFLKWMLAAISPNGTHQAASAMIGYFIPIGKTS
jgi:hypothetical protein